MITVVNIGCTDVEVVGCRQRGGVQEVVVIPPGAAFEFARVRLSASLVVRRDGAHVEVSTPDPA